ncbi:class I SAM-dependent methyltransferase [Streptomyces sp. ADMS]|uniref:class I SAM-dependent methyltransferase n=1 Tax=Streptomyces sp. ADMS TaxID=3071415 RepID=UPI00296F75DB|nr:class I SAM-dependent methyltransferase [Streptomyces sp. ADMS]MDW4909129.1 class I SAM-dependent methyltransferase [Streptomyces sp. ADMS]
MEESTGSLWEQTTDVDYMRKEGRDTHPSYDWLNGRLVELYDDTVVDFLDCGVMSGTTYAKLKDTGLSCNYTGIDIGEPLLESCRSRFPEARWRYMSVTDLSFPSGAFDVVNCRHLLESLPYYETAVREMFRVARRHVAICFFQPPRDPEALLRRDTAGGYIWLNRYSPGPFEDLLAKLSDTVERIDISQGRRTDRMYFCTKSV